MNIILSLRMEFRGIRSNNRLYLLLSAVCIFAEVTIMHIGICCIKIYMETSHSLKDRRGITRSLVERVRNRFNVSVAEESDNNLWQTSDIVFCSVGNDIPYLNGQLSSLLTYIESLNLDLEVIDCSTEIISGI